MLSSSDEFGDGFAAVMAVMVFYWTVYHNQPMSFKQLGGAEFGWLCSLSRSANLAIKNDVERYRL
jgi:hypothetical protein